MRATSAPPHESARPGHASSGAGEGVGAAHAKAILIGEHAAVYGAPAIVLPVHELMAHAQVSHAQVSHRQQTGARGAGGQDPAAPSAASASSAAPAASVGDSAWTLQCSLYDGPIEGAPSFMAPVIRAWQHTAERTGLQGPGRLVITGGIPIRSGLGSSAAVSAAVIDAVAAAAEVVLAPQERSELLAESETLAHGRASGIDAAAVLADGPIFVEHGVARPLPLGPAGQRFVLADTGVPGMTATAVAGVRELHREQPVLVDALVARLEALTHRAARALAEDDVEDLGTAMDAAHEALTELGVSSEPLDHLVQAARAAGAAGAKLTGGGLGGCLIALSRTPDTAELEAALREAGAVGTWTTSCGGDA